MTTMAPEQRRFLDAFAGKPDAYSVRVATIPASARALEKLGLVHWVKCASAHGESYAIYLGAS
jgi:hypothetical protein